MIEIHITMTGRGYHPSERFSIFNEETHRVTSMDEARQYLLKRYGNCKRAPMYCDEKDGSTKRVGWVYGFRNADLSHSPVNKWIQQDWVSFSECKQITL